MGLLSMFYVERYADLDQKVADLFFATKDVKENYASVDQTVNASASSCTRTRLFCLHNWYWLDGVIAHNSHSEDEHCIGNDIIDAVLDFIDEYTAIKQQFFDGVFDSKQNAFSLIMNSIGLSWNHSLITGGQLAFTESLFTTMKHLINESDEHYYFYYNAV
jgi:hypothetical protein